MERFFITIYQKLQAHKITGIFLLLFFVIIAGFGAFQLEFKEDITALIPKSEKAEKLQRLMSTVNFSDKIIVNFSAKDIHQKDELVSVAKAFIDSLKPLETNSIEKIQGQISSDEMDKTYVFVQQNVPLFLNESDYQQIEERLAGDSLQNRLQGIYKSVLSPAGSFTKKYMLNDPLQITPFGLEKLKQLRIGAEFQVYQNFLLTQDGKNLLLFLTPKLDKKNSTANKELVNKLNKITQTITQKNDSISAYLFGSLFYNVANASQIKEDIQLTLGIALSILLVILIVFYRKIHIPLVLFLPSILGAISALAFVCIVQQEISLIALGIGAILLGISIDYALHVLTHYRNHTDVKKLYREVSSAVMMSSLTTATAFICLIFVDSQALKDLGIFAAISVVVSAFLSLILIPQLYQPKIVNHQKNTTLIDRLANFPFEKSVVFKAIISITFLFGILNFYKVDFQEDLSSLNYESKSLQKSKDKLASITFQDEKSIYLIAHGDNLDKALATTNTVNQELQELQKNNTILSFSSVGNLVLSEKQQRQKIEQWNSFWSNQRKKKLQENLISEGKQLGFKASTFSGFYDLLDKKYQSISLADYKKVPNFSVDEFINKNDKEEFYTVLSSVKVSAENITLLKEHFSDQKNISLIDRQGVNQELLSGLKEHFNNLLLYSFGAIFLLLLLYYKNLRLSIITLLPIAITWIIALGIMHFFSISFNIFNVIITTFIFGLGVDYSIFLTNGLRHQITDKNYKLKTHKTSIVLSVMTTLLGMGALIFAVHPALKSLALISIIGILTAALVSFCLQPIIFKLLMKSSTND